MGREPLGRMERGPLACMERRLLALVNPARPVKSQSRGYHADDIESALASLTCDRNRHRSTRREPC